MNGVQEMDILARHLLEKKRFRTSDMSVTKKAFEPPRDMKLSTFVVTGKTESDIENIGKQHVSGPASKTLYGWGIISGKDVHALGLCADRDDNPPCHANIIDWPDKEELVMELQLKLASVAKLILV